MRRKLALALVLLLLCTLFSGCMDKLEVPGPEPGPEQQTDPPEEEETVLRVLLWKSTDTDWANLHEYAKKPYELKHKNIKIQYEEYDPDRTSSQILAGNGPDLYDTSALAQELDYHLILQKGFLRDLTPLIQESGFSLEDYPSNLMDVGVYQGERLLLPFWFAPDFLISSKATEEKYGLELRGQMTCDQFLEACRPAAEDGLPLIGTYLPFSTYLQAINLPIADYEQKKPLVNTPEFREACEFYQSFYPQMAEYLDREGESYPANAFDRLCKGQALFTLNLYGVESSLIQFDAILRQETGQGISAYPFPSPVESSAKYALTYAAVGVSETCRLPEEAFDYIVEFLNVWKYGLRTIHKDFIGYEFTKTAASIEAGNTFPAQVYNYTAPITQVPEELQSWYVEYLNNAIGVFQEFNIYDFLDEMYPYFEGKASYEECLETLENQLFK